MDVATHKSSQLRLIRRVDNDAAACAQCGQTRRPLFRYGRQHPTQDNLYWDSASYCNRECRALAQAAAL